MAPIRTSVSLRIEIKAPAEQRCLLAVTLFVTELRDGKADTVCNGMIRPDAVARYRGAKLHHSIRS